MLSLAVLALALGSGTCFGGEVIVNPVKANNLPINVASQGGAAKADTKGATNTLVSPSKPQSVEANKTNATTKEATAVAPAATTTAPAVAKNPNTKKEATEKKKDEFDFDLKMKAKNASGDAKAKSNETSEQHPLITKICLKIFNINLTLLKIWVIVYYLKLMMICLLKCLKLKKV